MLDPVTPPRPPDATAQADERRPARADFADGVGWIAFGFSVLVGSLTMDRLERQNINPYTVPGLLPGLLGIATIVLGGILALRSWRRGALREPRPALGPAQREERRRIGVVTALCVGYGVVLIGHGLPFWFASAIYVTGSILVLHRIGREPDASRSTWGGALKALAIGLGASLITQGVFQELFLVRLP
jgi:hypothetical protein